MNVRILKILLQKKTRGTRTNADYAGKLTLEAINISCLINTAETCQYGAQYYEAFEQALLPLRNVVLACGVASIIA